MTTTKEDKLFNIYYNTNPSCKMITKEGHVIVFVDHKHITDNPKTIAYLDEEITLRHPHLYVKKGEEKKLASDLDPNEVLRKKHIAEYLAELEESKVAKDPDEIAAEVAAKKAAATTTTTPVSPTGATKIAEALEKARIKNKEAVDSGAALKPASSVDLSSISPNSNS